MKKSATIRDVAREAGVSVAVVSRVLNDGTGPVAPLTRAKVVETIERLGYHPRAAARELQQKTTSTIGLVLADLANPFFARLADRVVWEARARGVHVVLLTTQEDAHLEAESIDTLLERSVAAVIATPAGGNVDKWARLMELGVDVVFVDREIEGLPETDVVTIRNDVSAEAATNHLLSLGHTRIGFISGPADTSTGRDRVRGFRRAMESAGLAADDELIHHIPFRGDAGSDAAGALLGMADPPSAIIVGNTAQVRSALRRIKQADVDVPGDLSLVVFDDNPWTELVSPPLTVVRQPIEMLAVHSVDLAVGRAKGLLPEQRRRIEVESELVRRSSTAPVTQHSSAI